MKEPDWQVKLEMFERWGRTKNKGSHCSSRHQLLAECLASLKANKAARAAWFLSGY